jgi:hypothetical protein
MAVGCLGLEPSQPEMKKPALSAGLIRRYPQQIHAMLVAFYPVRLFNFTSSGVESLLPLSAIPYCRKQPTSTEYTDIFRFVKSP